MYKPSRQLWFWIAAALVSATGAIRQATGGIPKSGHRARRHLFLGLPALAVALALTPSGAAFAKKVHTVVTALAQFCTAPLPGTNLGCIGGVCGATGSMEGALKVAPGDQIDAGYTFQVNNTTGAPITVIVSARVVYPVKCPDNTFDYLVVPLNDNTSALPSPTNGGYGDELAMAPVGSNAGLNCDNNASPDSFKVGGPGDGECTYSVATGSHIIPASSQNSLLTYQSGNWQVPATLCGGVQGNVDQGVVFVGSITTNDQKDPYVFHFHYGSTNKSGHGLSGTSVSPTFTPGPFVCTSYGVNKTCGVGTFNGDTANTVTYPIFGAITETGGSDSGFTITDNPTLDAGSLTCYRPGVGGNAATCVGAAQPTTVTCNSVTLATGDVLCYQGTFTSAQNGGSDTITVTDAGSNSQQANASCAKVGLSPALFVTKSCTVKLVPDPENDGQVAVEVFESGTITNTTPGACSNSDNTSCTADSQCAKGEECGSAGQCIIACSTNSDCGNGNTCGNASSSGDDGLSGITLSDSVPGLGTVPITLSKTTLAPGESETYTNSYFPTVLGTCKDAPQTSCLTNAQCGTTGTCVPADLTDTVTVQGACNSVACTGTTSDTASATCPICPSCPNCPFNLQ